MAGNGGQINDSSSTSLVFGGAHDRAGRPFRVRQIFSAEFRTDFQIREQQGELNDAPGSS
jgi:hypothetical protein